MPDKEKLQQIVDDENSSDTERAEAQAELDANHSVPETAVDARLEDQLLFEYHAASLADIQHHDLHAFCTSLKFSPAAQNLYMRWLSVSPVAQSKLKEMNRHLRNYLLASYDTMLARYRASLDRGSDMNAENREALAFYRNWTDSCVTPEELKPHFREMIAALSARCEGHHDSQSR